MTDSDTPAPHRFSLMRLIIIVNLLGLGIVPFRGADWPRLAATAGFVAGTFACGLLTYPLHTRNQVPPRIAVIGTLRSASWLALCTFSFLGVMFYLCPDIPF